MILLIDGHSGSGKTTFAARVHGALGWPVIHLEDVYPGWDGLAAASEARGFINHQPRSTSGKAWFSTVGLVRQ